MGKLRKFVRWLRLKLSDDEFTLLQGGGGSFAVKVAGAGLSFGSQVALARILGAESFGVYVYALNCAKIAVLIGTLGFSTASVRFVAEYISNEKWSLLKEYLRYSRRTTFILSIVVAVVFGTGAFLIYAPKNPEQAWTFAIAAVVIPLSVQMKVGSAELRGLKHVVRARLPKSVALPSVLVVAVFLSGGVLGLSPTGVVGMSGYVIAVAGAMGLIDWFRTRSLPARVAATGGYSMKGRRAYWLKTARDMVLIAGFNMILFRADTIMVGALVNPEAAGIYNVGSKIAHLLLFGLIAVNTILSPIASDLFSSGRTSELRNIVTRGAQASLAFSVVFIFCLLIFQNQVLKLFGEGFIEAKLAMWILVGGQLVNAAVGPAVVLLNMTGNQRTSAWILGGTSVVNISLNLFLIPLFGIEGAALSTAISLVIWNSLSVWFSKKRIDILPIPI